MFFAALITATGSLPVLILGTYAAQFSATYRLGSAELGLYISLFFGIGALTSFLAGRWARSQDWLLITMLAGVLSLFVALSLAWSPFGESKWALASSMMVGGFAFAIAAPTATRAILGSVPVGRSGLWFGVKQAGVPVAAVVCGLSLWLVAEPLGWRVGIVSCCSVIMLNLAVSQIIRLQRHASIKKSSGPPVTGVLEELHGGSKVRPFGSHPSEANSLTRPPKLPIQRAPLFLIAIAVMCACVLVSASQTFFIVSASSRGVALGTAGALLAIGSAVGVIFRILFGVWTDRKGLREFRVVSLLLLLGVLGALCLAIPGITPVFVGGTFIFAFGWGWQGLFHLGLVKAAPEDPTVATGIGMTGAALGMTVGAPFFGAASSEWGYSEAWIVTGGLASLGVIAFFIADALLNSATRRPQIRDDSPEATTRGIHVHTSTQQFN